MNREEFQELIYKQIPITKKMDFTIEEFSDEKISVKALLETNINHKSTAFGGSINTLLTMCGWAAVFKHIKPVDEEAHIVIQKSSVNYLKPITEDFTAVFKLKDSKKMQKFINTYIKRGKSRIEISTSIEINGVGCADFTGIYVVFK